MKKKFFFILLIIILIGVTACEKKEEKEEREDGFVTMQEKEIIEQTEDGEITKGTVEGYTFTETDKITSRVKIQLENGGIILMVLSNKDAPIAIENFQNLVSNKYYDGLIFHRVINGFMIQTGDPTGTGSGGSDETIKGEFKNNGVNNHLSHTRGVVSMARRGGNPDTAETMNSASSQFFIVQEDSTYLDGSYASFGKVFAGMEVVDEIAGAETDSYDKPLKEIKIKSIRFIEVN